MPNDSKSTWIIDLDGVIWLADHPIPGSPEAVDRLRAGGVRPLFVTNNSSLTVEQYLAKLAGMGVQASADELVTSAQAAASLLEPGTSAVLCAGPGAEEALRSNGVEVRSEGPADVVVVGWHRDFDFHRLTVACRAVWSGARLVATNEDATYPTPDGLLPGAGSILAAVTTATAATPVIAGKPHQPIVDLLHKRAPNIELVVGDRVNTDGLLARRLQVPFGLVLSGVTRSADEAAEVNPVEVAPDFARLVARRGGHR
ncbi:MAG TPA: HAD-IIA family hydrolase [Acidimicrobiales bacterium]|nr:HAD-IIA family hydrolase [Acidimicrobiales bacterium]